MRENILVSCTVLTYNSASTVIETLESIKAQTYSPIELIISDDCSKDNTVEKCREWLQNNKERFVRVELLTVDKNTGVSANGNRAVAACKGVWRKGIAADDKLLPKCVENFIDFVAEHPEARWVSSKMRAYRNTFDEENYLEDAFKGNKSFFELDVKGQLNKMATWNRISAPSLFFNTDFFNELGGYNSEYAFEDYPFFVKALEHGYKCYFMDKETVSYRIHDSISHTKGQLFNYAFMQESKRFHIKQLFKYLTWRQKLAQRTIWKVQDSFETLRLNKETRFTSFLYDSLYKILNRLGGLR